MTQQKKRGRITQRVPKPTPKKGKRNAVKATKWTENTAVGIRDRKMQ